MPAGKFLSYRSSSKQNSLKCLSSYCLLSNWGPLRWAPSQSWFGSYISLIKGTGLDIIEKVSVFATVFVVQV